MEVKLVYVGTTTLEQLDVSIDVIDEPNRSLCYRFLDEHRVRLTECAGSSHNHQAWPGGYLDHVAETMSVAIALHEMLSRRRRLSFSESDALLVMFLHDIEKPWKEDYHALVHELVHESLGFGDASDCGLAWDKTTRKIVRDTLIKKHGFELTSEQQNALRYVEGEGIDYSSQRRVMNELAAFCHMCDVASARIWHDQPQKEREA